MEKTEPTFVPEWLKSSGSLSATSHQFTSSLHSDEQGVSKSLRNKSLVNGIDNDLGHPSVSDRTTSSYFRRANSSNGSGHLRSYSSFGRNHCDRDWDKNIYEFQDKDRDYSYPLGNIFPSKFEKDGLRRYHSSLSTKRGESWPRKSVCDKNGNNDGSALLSGVKTAFQRDFPSLGAEEKQTDSEIGRVPSPGFTSVIQSLLIGNSAVIGGDGWTSALAEVPMIVGSNGSNISVQPIQPGSVSATTSVTIGRNMAETLVQGPPRDQTAPQLSVGTQRLEELAVKQSRQLIPMTPSMPKALALNSSDKAKPEVQSPRPVSMKSDVTKTSTVGKLHVLKPSRERNGRSPTSTANDSLSPTSGSKLPNSPLAVPVRNTSAAIVAEKRPSPQAQSRNDFFNLVRKKSMTDNSSPDTANDRPDEGGSSENGGKKNDANILFYSEEEEARFLRSLGWEETTEEDGLTEEEINSFYRNVSKYLNLKPASNFLKGTQPKSLMAVNFEMGKNGDS